jgi:alkylation response protein AidB-like acyl-CoA dehydrogenase
MDNTKWTQHLDLDNEVKRITSAYSEADREKFTNKLLEVVKTSKLMRLLDESIQSGPHTLREVLKVCQSLGKIDASLAWVVGVSNAAWSMYNCFHSLTTSDLGSEQNGILTMVLGRPGSLKKDKASNSYLLNGQWKYASGWCYARFFFCLAVIEGTDSSDIQVIAVPAQLLEVSEDWKATGLRATQSVTVLAKDIKIPKSKIENYSQILSGRHIVNVKDPVSEKRTAYSRLFTGVLMNCLLGAILGATEAGLEYVEAAANKHHVAGSSYTFLSDSGAIRAEIGRLRSTLDLYQRAAEYNADVIDEAACNPHIALTIQNRVDNRCRAAQVMRGCVSIIQDLLWIYGSSGMEKGNPLERIWRDVNVGARHGGFSKLIPEEAVGLVRIGRDPKNLTNIF